MVKVRVRLYRGHDYDLLPLAENYGASFASIAKNTLEALFLGKEYQIDITTFHYVPTKPVKKELVNGEAREKVKPIVYLVKLSDKDCPGIESWFKGFTCGHRNNLVKLSIRRALGSFPIEAYRNDGWMSAEQESKEVKAILASIEKEASTKETSVTPKNVAKDKEKNISSDSNTHASILIKESEDKREEISDSQEGKDMAEKHMTSMPQPRPANMDYEEPVSHEQEYTNENDVTNENTEDDDNEFDVLGAFESLHL